MLHINDINAKGTPLQDFIDKHLSPIDVLMSRPKIPTYIGKGKNARPVVLGREQKITGEIADKIRSLTVEKKLIGIWFHIPNEGLRGWLSAIIIRYMGLIPGVYDFLHIWPKHGFFDVGFIEIKIPDEMGVSGKTGKIIKKHRKTDRNDNQKHFGVWCDMWRIKHVVVRSWDEYYSTLREWGAVC